MASSMSKNDKNVLQMILNPNLPLVDDDEPTSDELQDPDAAFDQSKVLVVKEMERNGVKHAEAKQYEAALKCFDQAIDVLPERPSGFNNRAQCKRLAGDIKGALEDLNTAISLTSECGKVAGLAFVQRALILKLQGDQEGAEKDFTKAAQLGNSFAKQELVQSNPYAALCNKMLTQVIGDLQKGKSGQ